MSQIQNASNSAYAAQWQYLQAIQQAGSGDPMVQPGASDAMSFGLDPLSGPSGQAQPTQGGNSGPPFSLGAMSALIAAQEQSSGTTGLSAQQQKVFGELDANGDGTVTAAELQGAFGSDNTDIANYVMGKLDTDGDGSISQGEFGAGTTRSAGHHHHHMHMGAMPGAQGADGQTGAQGPLARLLAADGANAQTTSNSDGSTTTTISYSDGSKVSMTSAASSGAAAGSGDGAASGATGQQTQQNLLEQLIKMQAQLVQSVAPTTAATI